MNQNSLYLLLSKRFLPIFIVQFCGAFNDNVLRNAFVILIFSRIHPCHMSGLRMRAKIYDFQKTNLKHKKTQLKIELDKDLFCETGIKKHTASIIIVAICVVALFVVIWIGFFIIMKIKKNKENIELDDIADVEQ